MQFEDSVNTICQFQTREALPEGLSPLSQQKMLVHPLKSEYCMDAGLLYRSASTDTAVR